MSDVPTEAADPRPIGTVVGMITGVAAVSVLGGLGGALWIGWLWSRSSARVRATISVGRRRAVLWCAWSTLVVGAIGLAATVRSLTRAFDTVANVDPAEKARVLGRAISDAMNYTAAALVLQYLGCVFLLVAGWVLLRRGSVA